jgi:sortase B
MKKGLLVAIIMILIVAFAVSALYLATYFADGIKHQNKDNALAEAVSSAKEQYSATDASDSPYGVPGSYGYEDEYYTPDVIDEPENTPTRPVLESGSDFLPWYEELHSQNTDMVGWIQIENTKINYPVMQTSQDNANYYLYRDFDKNDSVRGSIYAAEICDVFKPSDNITLFGHNMKDGSMFAYLGNYYEKSTWEENSLIFFDTLTESHVYKIFSVFKTSGTDNVGFAYHLMADAADEEEFNEFIATCKELAFYDTGITPVYGDKILCLSTCEYTIDNGRFVVAAVRIT